MKTKHPDYFMVFGVVTNNSDVMPRFIFQYGVRHNTGAYIKGLEDVVLTWIERVAYRRTYAWQ